MHRPRRTDIADSAAGAYRTENPDTANCAHKAQHSDCRGKTFRRNSAVDAGFAHVTNNVDRTDITDGVISGNCSDCIGCKDDKCGAEIVPSSNCGTTSSGKTNYVIRVVLTAVPMSVGQPAQSNVKEWFNWTTVITRVTRIVPLALMVVIVAVEMS